MSVNIMVRKRAKEACAYAKQLNPELSTWFQNKPTKARNYAGKVLLTVKSPKQVSEDGLPARYISPTNNPWLDRCKDFNYSSEQAWGDVYRQVVNSVCKVERIDPNVIDVVYAPGVDPLDPLVREYIDTAYFSHTYFSQYIDTDYPKWTFVIASPEDTDWWEQSRERFTVVDDDITGCQFFEENDFCSFKYSPQEDQTTIDGTVVLMVVKQGSPADVDITVDPAHNAPHWYQKANSFQHWHLYLIEGHATMYENAFYILKHNRDNYREGYVWQAYSDPRPFRATTAEQVQAHYEYCDKNPECNHFKYGVASMFHEKLILDYGYESYLEWMRKMEGISSAKKRVLGPPPGISRYLQIFEQHFGLSHQSFLDTGFNPFAAESFNVYYDIWLKRGQVKE